MRLWYSTYLFYFPVPLRKPSCALDLDFSDGSDGKESACNAGDLGWEDPLEEDMTTYSSILVWKIVRGLKESDTTERLSTNVIYLCFCSIPIYWLNSVSYFVLIFVLTLQKVNFNFKIRKVDDASCGQHQMIEEEN